MANRFVLKASLLLLLTSIFFSLLSAFQPAFSQNPIRGCFSCHSDPTLTKKAAGKTVSLFIDPLRYSKGVHATTACSECHLNFALQSPHANVNQATLLESATVSCRDCHEETYNKYINSLHAKSLREKDKEGPTCARCHNVHYSKKFPKSPGFKLKLEIASKCGHCHEEAYKELKGNYHYRALQLGYSGSASCEDCHDVHGTQKIEAGTEEAAVGCRNCHPQANANMAGFLIHTEPESPKAPLILRVILLFMTVLTAGTLGAMYLHSFLWFLRKFIEGRRDRKI